MERLRRNRRLARFQKNGSLRGSPLSAIPLFLPHNMRPRRQLKQRYLQWQSLVQDIVDTVCVTGTDIHAAPVHVLPHRTATLGLASGQWSLPVPHPDQISD